MKFLDKGILDVLVPVEINGNEEFIIGSPNISNEQVQEYLDRLNEFYETKMYELYEKVNEETGEIIGEFTPKKDEKIIRIVPISPTKIKTKSIISIAEIYRSKPNINSDSYSGRFIFRGYIFCSRNLLNIYQSNL